MKKLFYILSLLLICQFAKAQVTGRVDTIITPDASNKALVEFKIRWPDGKTHIIGKMLNEKKEGVWRSYTNRSIIETIREYHEGKLNGVSFHFSENGTLDQEENYKNDVLNGERNIYLYGSVIKGQENFVDGKLDGDRRLYYESGKMQEHANFKNGIRDGVTTWYTQDEKPTIEYTYKMGELEGLAKFYNNGILQSEGMYHNGNEEGDWKVYEDDALLKTVTYKEGKVVKEVAAKKK